MKYILIAALLIVFVGCEGQKVTTIYKNYPDSLISKTTPDVEVKQGNDTIFIYNTDWFKYIKFGERLYRIVPPGLEEVKEIWPMRQLPFNGVTGSGTWLNDRGIIIWSDSLQKAVPYTIDSIKAGGIIATPTPTNKKTMTLEWRELY